MAAFRGAKELGADWIELDVQQCKDGQIIVIHDANLQRTTGVNQNTWDMTYEEIEKLDAGSFFEPAYAGEKIPLLSEVVQFVKESCIKLNIELKPTGHETEFEKCVVDIIRDAGMKQIYVWTVNTQESIHKMIEKNVDNIITDDIELAKQCVYESRYSDLLMEYMKMFE